MHNPSSSSSSHTTSSASLARTRDHEDELTSYFSLLAAGNTVGGEGKKHKVVDWGKLLEEQFQVQSGEEDDSDVSDAYDDAVAQFFKASRKEPSAAERETDTGATINMQTNKVQKNPNPQPLTPSVSDVGLDPTYSMTETDSFTSNGTHKSADIEASTSSHTTTPPVGNISQGNNSESKKIKEPTTRQCAPQRVSEKMVSEIEETSEDLGQSSIFKNNIFTLDQLEASSDESTDTTEPAREKTQLYNIVSLTDIDEENGGIKEDVLHDSYASDIQGDTHAEGKNEYSYSVKIDETSDAHHSDEYSTSSFSYEEDFENEPTQSFNRVPDSPHTSFKSQQTGTKSSDDWSSHDFEQLTDTISHTSHHSYATAETHVDTGGADGSNEKREESCKDDSRAPASDVHCSECNNSRIQSLPTFPDLSAPCPTPLTPHFLPTHSATAQSLVSEALQDLLQCQLALTRALVTRSRSLAQHLSDSITPDYHYTTLEDTKKYISQHRPKVLSTKEAKQLVSQEESFS